MLAYLEGVIKERQNGEMILTVGAPAAGLVGYQIKTPDHPRYERFIPGERAEIYIYTHVREDAFDLYGFLSSEEKNLYTTLLSVSGVGPKLALTLLSNTEVSHLIHLIIDEEKEALTQIPGVGKKTAERMVLELKDTIRKKLDLGIFGKQNSSAQGSGKNTGDSKDPRVSRSSQLFMEGYLALQGLGYKEPQAKQMVENTLRANQSITKVEDLIKVALQGSVN